MECQTRLDHVVINVRHDMDPAEALCRSLGFTITPRGYHSLGSINHLMMFDTDYFELIGVPKVGTTKRADLITAPLDVFSAGRVYFCEHGTPDLVWRPEWQGHANGAMEIAEVVVVAEDVPNVAAAYAKLVEGEVVVLRGGVRAIDIADTRLTFRTPHGYREQYGDLASDMGGRDSIFGALVFRTASLALVAGILEGLPNQTAATIGPESIVVRLAEYDSVLEFIGPEE
jgi:hypothetical protein